MEKSKSKISLLIERINPKEIPELENQIENNYNSQINNSLNNILSFKSTYHSSIKLGHSNNMNKKIELYIYYTLCEIIYKKIKIIINENYSISSMISYTIDKINEKLIVNGGFKINDNENLYEIRYAKKDGSPNYNKPFISKCFSVKDFPGKKLTLCLKKQNFLKDDFYKKQIQNNLVLAFDNYFFE